MNRTINAYIAAYAGDWQSWFRDTFNNSTDSVERWLNKFVSDDVKQIRAAKPNTDAAERMRRMLQRNISFPLEIVEKLEELAAEHETTLSDIIRQAVNEYLFNHNR
ncbi:CopG family transcriptional regulator [Chroococcidiopsis sp. FACHB-1243]|uniref:ribbon-helix-helix protein, CopG family n=1 Tax=Chroococcidiopsis sp. [FACHB-1243] TaxID=2692781 RepID=UPI0017822B20|nr:ribbon-helix-helix protein, CopG family [Chroococcidiopsis sp. [FACHB-1243]]MBD2305838.1 CopG family transcriptional regulator [Chroococcidiopsis sp. [FACHB-1243]]